MSKVKIMPQKYIDKIISHNPYATLTSTAYVNEDTELKIFCQKHEIEYSQTLKNALRRNGCPECRKERGHKNSYTTEEFRKLVYLKILISKY